MSTSRTVRNMAVAVSLLLPLLAACGSSTTSGSAGSGTTSTGTTTAGTPSAGTSGQLSVPADASADLKKQYLAENAIALCMKKQGFSYTPEAPDDAVASWATAGADYKLTEQFRQKYGYGGYSRIVYPDDPQLPGSAASEKVTSANSDYLATLTPAQTTAYNKAMGSAPDSKVGQKDWTGCEGTARKQVYGSATLTQQDMAASDEANREAGQALNGDPTLVSLAQSYAACLRNDGITVTTTQPTSISDMVQMQVDLALPPSISGAVNPDGTPLGPPMTKDEALPLLAKEIHLAMQDLACGKAFRAAYFPKFLKNPYHGAG